MNRRKDEDWLDEQLKQVINTTRPEFDAEAWKHRYPRAHAALTPRRCEVTDFGTALPYKLRLAVAAVILIGVALLWIQKPTPELPAPPMETTAPVRFPAQMVSMMTLRAAYRQGGQEGLNRQLDSALKTLGPRPDELSLLRVLRDLDG